MLKNKIKGPILITGARGMLGSDIAEVLRSQISPEEVIETDYLELNILDSKTLDQKVSQLKPYWIINTAAYTDVDKAEAERDLAFQINVEGPRNLTAVAKKVGARLVHFSTDYVFSGEGERPWMETDEPHPISPNWYAETKWQGDQAVMSEARNLILRVQWLYGRKRERFSLLRSKEVFTPFVDQFGAPTWTVDIAKTLAQLLRKEASGLFHYAYDDFTNWFEVYDLVKKEWNLKTELIPKKSAEVKLPAKRPLNGRLSNQKIKDFLGLKSLGSWRDSLTKFLRTELHD